jgi:nicotinamidase-related amidase
MGLAESHREALRICERYIAPGIATSRAAGLPIFHVEPANIATKYPSHTYLLDDPTPAPPRPARPPEAIPGWQQQRSERSHGVGYAAWAGWQQMRIVRCCDADEAQGDQVVVTGAQFDRILRQRGITNLIYAGFKADMCILSAEGGMQQMLSYGYRVFLIREATLGTEDDESFPRRLGTAVALKYIELKVGDTISFDQYVAACRDVAAVRAVAA